MDRLCHVLFRREQFENVETYEKKQKRPIKLVNRIWDPYSPKYSNAMKIDTYVEHNEVSIKFEREGDEYRRAGNVKAAIQKYKAASLIEEKLKLGRTENPVVAHLHRKMVCISTCLAKATVHPTDPAECIGTEWIYDPNHTTNSTNLSSEGRDIMATGDERYFELDFQGANEAYQQISEPLVRSIEAEAMGDQHRLQEDFPKAILLYTDAVWQQKQSRSPSWPLVAQLERKIASIKACKKPTGLFGKKGTNLHLIQDDDDVSVREAISKTLIEEICYVIRKGDRCYQNGDYQGAIMQYEKSHSLRDAYDAKMYTERITWHRTYYFLLVMLLGMVGSLISQDYNRHITIQHTIAIQNQTQTLETLLTTLRMTATTVANVDTGMVEKEESIPSLDSSSLVKLEKDQRMLLLILQEQQHGLQDLMTAHTGPLDPQQASYLERWTKYKMILKDFVQRSFQRIIKIRHQEDDIIKTRNIKYLDDDKSVTSTPSMTMSPSFATAEPPEEKYKTWVAAGYGTVKNLVTSVKQILIHGIRFMAHLTLDITEVISSDFGNVTSDLVDMTINVANVTTNVANFTLDRTSRTVQEWYDNGTMEILLVTVQTLFLGGTFFFLVVLTWQHFFPPQHLGRRRPWQGQPQRHNPSRQTMIRFSSTKQSSSPTPSVSTPPPKQTSSPTPSVGTPPPKQTSPTPSISQPSSAGGVPTSSSYTDEPLPLPPTTGDERSIQTHKSKSSVASKKSISIYSIYEYSC